MDLERYCRPEIRGFEPYLPGKPVEEVRRELGLKKIVKLASNENALGASKRAVAAVRKTAAGVYQYPASAGALLRKALAKHLDVLESQVILGAGSDELIEILGKTFFNPSDEIIISDHAFTRYKMAADLMGAKAVIVPARGYAHDLIRMAEKVTDRTKVIFIANPNNPTGTYANNAEVAEFFAILKVRSRSSSQSALPFVVFDEAYYEFAKQLAPDYPETLDYFRKGWNVIVLRTFSKIYGLAGLRVGYGVMNDEVVRILDRVRPPFNVTSVSQAAAIEALKDQVHVKKSAAAVRQGLKYLTAELAALRLKFVPSVGNFILVDASPRTGSGIFESLLRKGVIVRAMNEYGYPNHFRVSVGTPAENKFFIQNLKRALIA